MVASLFFDLAFDEQDLLVQRVEHIRVDLDAGRHHGVVEVIGDSLSVGRPADRLLKRWQIVLMAGVLNMTE